MEPSQINLDLCRERLNPLDAFLFDNLENSSSILAGDSEISVAWKFATQDGLNEMRWFLQLYTWPTNTTKIKYIVDPVINGETYKGRWRQAYVREMKRANRQTGVDEYYVILTLRYGFITSLLSGAALDWSEARIESGKQLPAGTNTTSPGGNTTELYRIVRWPNIAPSSVKAIIDEVAGLSVNSFTPVIDGESFGTDWHRLYVTDAIEDDGSATISILLAKPEFVLEGFSTWATEKQTAVTYHWNVPKNLAQAVLDAEKGTGKTTSCSYDTSNGTVDITVYTKDFTSRHLTNIFSSQNCDAFVYDDIYWNVYNPTIYGNFSNVNGITYSRNIDSNGDGSYTVTLRARVTQYRNYSTLPTFYSAFLYRTDHLQLGLTSQTPDDISNPPRGIVYSQEMTPRDDCSKDYRTRIDQGLYRFTATIRSRSSGDQSAFESVYRNASDMLAAHAFAAGALYQTRNSLNEFYLYDIEETIVLARQQTVGEHTNSQSFAEERNNSFARNSATAKAMPTAAQGYLYRATNRINEFDLYDWEYEAIHGLYQFTPTIRSISSGGATVYESFYRNRTSMLPATAFATGAIYKTDGRINEFNLYDVTETINLARAQSIPFHVSNRTHLISSSTTKDRNRTDPRDATTPSQGYFYRSNNSINEYDLYDIETDAFAGIYQWIPTARSTSGPGAIVYEKIILNSTTPLEGPAPEQGFIYRSANKMNEFQLYDASLDINKGIYRAVALNQTTDSLFRSIYETVELNASSIPSVPHHAAGVTYQKNTKLNDYSLYDTDIVASVSHPGFVYKPYPDRWGDSLFYSFRNITNDQLTAAIALIPSNYQTALTIDMNEDVTYNGSITASLDSSRGTGTYFVGEDGFVIENEVSFLKDEKNPNTIRYKVDTWYFYSQYFDDRASACAFVNAGNGGLPAKTKVTWDSHGLWYAEYGYIEKAATQWRDVDKTKKIPNSGTNPDPYQP